MPPKRPSPFIHTGQHSVTLLHHIKLYQPWARVVCEGALPVLVRRRSTRIRGWVGVVSAVTFDGRTIVYGRTDKLGFPLGSLIGAIRIDDVAVFPDGPTIRETLARRFGKTLATFYPEHYIPTGVRPVFIWRVGAAILSHNPAPVRAGSGREWSRFRYRIRDPEIFSTA